MFTRQRKHNIDKYIENNTNNNNNIMMMMMWIVLCIPCLSLLNTNNIMLFRKILSNVAVTRGGILKESKHAWNNRIRVTIYTTKLCALFILSRRFQKCIMHKNRCLWLKVKSTWILSMIEQDGNQIWLEPCLEAQRTFKGNQISGLKVSWKNKPEGRSEDLMKAEVRSDSVQRIEL